MDADRQKLSCSEIRSLVILIGDDFDEVLVKVVHDTVGVLLDQPTNSRLSRRMRLGAGAAVVRLASSGALLLFGCEGARGDSKEWATR